MNKPLESSDDSLRGECLANQKQDKPSTNTRRPLDKFAITVAVVCCFIWALQQVAIKGSGSEVDPLLQVVIRTTVALILLAFTQIFYLKEPWNPQVKWWHGVLVGFFYFAEFFCVAQALRLGPSSHVAVLLYTAPMWTAMGLSVALKEERMNLLQWSGVITAFGGVAFSILYPALTTGNGSPTDANWLLGDLFGLLAGLTWGLTTIIIRVTPMSSAAPTQMLFWQLFAGLFFFIGATVWTGQTHFEPHLLGWSNLIFQSLIVSFASYLAWCYLLRNYLASRLGVLCFLTPIFSIILSVLMLGEVLSLAFILGALLVLVGLVVVQFSQIKLWWRAKQKARRAKALEA